MNRFREASLQELYIILRLVDIKPLNRNHLDTLDRWATDHTTASRTFSARSVIDWLTAVEDK